MTVARRFSAGARRRKAPKMHYRDWEPFESTEGQVRLLLIVEWDPIGVWGMGVNNLDEYDSYVSRIHALVMSGASVTDIAERLRQLEKEMGVRSGVRADSVAVRLRDIYRTWGEKPRKNKR